MYKMFYGYFELKIKNLEKKKNTTFIFQLGTESEKQEAKHRLTLFFPKKNKNKDSHARLSVPSMHEKIIFKILFCFPSKDKPRVACNTI